MTQPIIHDYLTQIFVKHYKITSAEKAAQEALRFLEIAELYGMQLIIGEWTVPEPAPPLSPFEIMAQTAKDTLEREPWNAVELRS